MKTKLHTSRPSGGTKHTPALLAVASLLAFAPAAWAASPSELLENGIYAEETKGDLDGALKLYQQAVTEAKGAQAVAAQAQFRVGVCYFKKGDFPAARAALEQVLKNYPEQKELVGQATDYLYRAQPLLPAPWREGREVRFEIKSADGVKRGSIIANMSTGETNGEKTWAMNGRVTPCPVRGTDLTENGRATSDIRFPHFSVFILPPPLPLGAQDGAGS